MHAELNVLNIDNGGSCFSYDLCHARRERGKKGWETLVLARLRRDLSVEIGTAAPVGYKEYKVVGRMLEVWLKTGSVHPPLEQNKQCPHSSCYHYF